MSSNIRPVDEQTDTMSEQMWKFYIDQSSKEDKETFDGWQSDMDSLLIFAALFSGVLTAFVIESYQGLLPDGGDSSVQILGQILIAIQSNGNASATLPIQISNSSLSNSNAVFVNTLWFMSLIFSLSAALLAILAKQWIRNLTIGISVSPVEGGHQRQLRHDGLQIWKLPSLITMFPVLLQFSLLLFFAGLAGFLWPINHVVAAVVIGLVSVAGFLYAISHILPLIYPSCPYKTSFTIILYGNILKLIGIVIILYHALVLAAIFLSLGCKSLWQVLLSCIKTKSGESDRRNTNTSSSSINEHWRKIQDAWSSSLYVSPSSGMELLQENYINSREMQSKLDKKALIWLVARSANSKNVLPLVQHISRLEQLFTLQTGLIEANAIRLLIKQLHITYKNRLHDPSTGDQLTRYSHTLVQLVTEMKEPEGLANVSRFDRAIESVWIASQSDPHSPIVRPILFTTIPIVEDLQFSTNLLRLQVALYKKNKLRFKPDFRSFYSALKIWYKRDDISTLAHRAAINTIIFIGTHESLSLPELELQQLIYYLRDAHNLSFEARKQICWGIYVLSQDPLSRPAFVLVPQVSWHINDLQGFFMLLSSDTRPQSLYAVLAAITNVLSSDLEIKATFDEAPDLKQTFLEFGREVVRIYPRFLTKYARIYTARTSRNSGAATTYDAAVQAVKISCLLFHFSKSPDTSLGKDLSSWDLKSALDPAEMTISGGSILEITSLSGDDAPKPKHLINVVSDTLHLLEYLSKFSVEQKYGRLRPFIYAAVGWITLHILGQNMTDSVKNLIDYEVSAPENDTDTKTIAQYFKKIFVGVEERWHDTSEIPGLGRDITVTLRSILMDIFRPTSDDKYTIGLREALLEEGIVDLLPTGKLYEELKTIISAASRRSPDTSSNLQSSSNIIHRDENPSILEPDPRHVGDDEDRRENRPSSPLLQQLRQLLHGDRNLSPAGSSRHGRTGRVPEDDGIRGRSISRRKDSSIEAGRRARSAGP